MYQFSRAIYRELAPYVQEDKPKTQRESNRELVLRECEEAITRLMTDRRYFARPSRTLFNNLRPYFAMGDLPRVYFVIDRNISFALDFLKREPNYAFDTTGVERCCQAMTRKGQPCQRQPLPASEYCPSHQHLEETFEELELQDLELAA
jgi:hypothetical protein